MDNLKICSVCGRPISRHWNLNGICGKLCFDETTVRIHKANNKDITEIRVPMSGADFALQREVMELNGTWGNKEINNERLKDYNEKNGTNYLLKK